jgi:cell division protein FtsL
MASFAPATARAYAPATKRRAPTAKPQARPRARPRSKARPRVAGGVLWIVVVAGLLAGIVALNVAVLRLNMQVEELDGKQSRLVSKRTDLESELSTAAAAGRVEELATGTLGLGAPVSTRYLELERHRK